MTSSVAVTGFLVILFVQLTRTWVITQKTELEPTNLLNINRMKRNYSDEFGQSKDTINDSQGPLDINGEGFTVVAGNKKTDGHVFDAEEAIGFNTDRIPRSVPKDSNVEIDLPEFDNSLIDPESSANDSGTLTTKVLKLFEDRKVHRDGNLLIRKPRDASCDNRYTDNCPGLEAASICPWDYVWDDQGPRHVECRTCKPTVGCDDNCLLTCQPWVVNGRAVACIAAAPCTRPSQK